MMSRSCEKSTSPWLRFSQDPEFADIEFYKCDVDAAEDVAAEYAGHNRLLGMHRTLGGE